MRRAPLGTAQADFSLRQGSAEGGRLSWDSQSQGIFGFFKISKVEGPQDFEQNFENFWSLQSTGPVLEMPKVPENPGICSARRILEKNQRLPDLQNLGFFDF